MKVDPAKLEAEAQELIAQYKGEVPAPQEEETPEEVQPEAELAAPEEPSETAEVPVEAPVEDERGECRCSLCLVGFSLIQIVIPVR